MSPADFVSVDHLWLQKSTKLESIRCPPDTIPYTADVQGASDITADTVDIQGAAQNSLQNKC